MAHLVVHVTDFQKLGSHTLSVGFSDGATRRIDFLPVLRGELFGPLKDPKVFGQVRLDPESRTLVWPNGADFDPATLHDWPQAGPALAARLGKRPRKPSPFLLARPPRARVS